MSKPFRLGVIGTGMVFATCHLPAIRKCKKVQITALVDADLARASKYAAELSQGAVAVSDIQGINGLVDGVIIASPNHLHVEHALQCISLGVPILIEKPLATTMAEALRIEEAANRQGVSVAVGFCRRFEQRVQRLREVSENLLAGDDVEYLFQFGRKRGWSPLTNYITSAVTAGGGAMVVNGTHYLDLAIDWFGFPLNSEYYDDSTGGPEANAVAYTTHGVSGRRYKGCIKISRTADLDSGMVIRSNRASIISRDSKPNELIVAVQGRSATAFKQVISTVPNDMYLAQLEDFIGMCQHGRAPVVGLKAGIENMRFLDEMYRARKPLAGDWYAEFAAVS